MSLFAQNKVRDVVVGGILHHAKVPDEMKNIKTQKTKKNPLKSRRDKVSALSGKSGGTAFREMSDLQYSVQKKEGERNDISFL